MAKFISDNYSASSKDKKNKTSLNSILSKDNYNADEELEKSKPKKIVNPQIVISNKITKPVPKEETTPENKSKTIKGQKVTKIRNKPQKVIDISPNRTVRIKKKTAVPKPVSLEGTPKLVVEPVKKKVDTPVVAPQAPKPVTVQNQVPPQPVNATPLPSPGPVMPTGMVGGGPVNSNIPVSPVPPRKAAKLENNIPPEAMIKFVVGMKVEDKNARIVPSSQVNNPIPVMPPKAVNQPQPVSPVPQNIVQNNPPVAPPAPVNNNNTPPNKMNKANAMLAMLEETSQPEETKPIPKISPVVLLAGVMLAVVIIFAGYYFLIDTPKRTFTTLLNEIYERKTAILKDNVDKAIEYNVNMSIANDDEEKAKTYEIINRFNYNGVASISADGTIAGNITINYAGSEMFTANLLKQASGIFLNSDDFEYPIRLTNLEGATGEVSDYENLDRAVYDTLKAYLKKAPYKKELVNTSLKKVTLTLDSAEVNKIITSLLDNTQFTDSLSNIAANKANSIRKSLEKIRDNSSDTTVYILLYTGLLKNKVKKIEISSSIGKLVTIEIEKDNLNFTMESSDTTIYTGNIPYNTLSDSGNITLNLNDITDGTMYSVEFTYNKSDGHLQPFSTEEAVDYHDLTEKDITEITNRLYEKEAVSNLLQDLGITDINELSTIKQN